MCCELLLFSNIQFECVVVGDGNAVEQVRKLTVLAWVVCVES